ncbi:heavy metal-associated isoprenylated plant protein 3-like [Phragmites australis]|uniref:heavy metal-associated isoprenylated plant protein 3-like n=1 Tax=Phragmites australis TaxID=29695 RepID=UPI002D76DCC9|nr:heavy metal-associated isoprenylated plant protein 3-like [Phragmites australis]
MGEEKKASKDGGGGGDKKKDAGAGPAAAGPQPIVLKVDLHCAGCASKVRKAIKRAPGVESVVPDVAAGKVIVTGAADAVELKERIEARAKKPVQIVSAGAGPPKKEKEKEKKADGGGEKKVEKEKGGGGGEKKGEKAKGGGDKKAEKGGGDKPKEEKKPKESKEETVTLKIRLHCDGCIDRIKRRIYKIKGVKDVAVDNAKDLVKVTGTMDAAALPAYLRDKLSRPVEVVAPSKKDGGGDKKADDKKDKGAGDGGDKKKDGGGGEEKKDKDKSAAASASVAPMPLANAGMYQMPPQYGYTPYPPAPGAYYGGGAPPPIPTFYPNAGFGQYPPPSYPYSAHVHAPQMFSDENPNACSVM